MIYQKKSNTNKYTLITHLITHKYTQTILKQQNMGASSDIDTCSDKNKDRKGEASITDPRQIQQQKATEYREAPVWHDSGIVDGVSDLNDGESGSFVNPMIVTNRNEVSNRILNNCSKWDSGLIIYWSTVALTVAQKNLRKKLLEARRKKRQYLYQYKQKQSEKLKKKARYTCKTCKSVFNSSMIYERNSSYYCPMRGCNVCLVNTPVVPKSIQKQISNYTSSYIEKTTEKEKKRKRTYDENTNPKKKSFKMAVSGVTWGGWGAC